MRKHSGLSNNVLATGVFGMISKHFSNDQAGLQGLVRYFLVFTLVTLLFLSVLGCKEEKLSNPQLNKKNGDPSIITNNTNNTNSTKATSATTSEAPKPTNPTSTGAATVAIPMPVNATGNIEPSSTAISITQKSAVETTQAGSMAGTETDQTVKSIRYFGGQSFTGEFYGELTENLSTQESYFKVFYNPQDQIFKAEGYIKNELKTLEMRFYFPNGNIQSIVVMNEKKLPESKMFYDSTSQSKLKKREKYYEGSLSEEIEYDENDTPQKVVSYYSNQTVRSKTLYNKEVVSKSESYNLNGEKEGTWIERDSKNRVLSKTTYRSGAITESYLSEYGDDLSHRVLRDFFDKKGYPVQVNMDQTLHCYCVMNPDTKQLEPVKNKCQIFSFDTIIE